MAELRPVVHPGNGRPGFVVELGPKDDADRARRILRKAVLEINDVVAELYENAVMPPRISESERENYRG